MSANAKKADELQQRLIQFGARTTCVAKALPRSEEGRYISQQLLRSGLAVAANYAEARAAESRADFLHKLRIVLKELNETQSWLEADCGEWSVFPRQNGRDNHGKPGTPMDHRRIDQNDEKRSESNLKFPNFPISESTIVEISKFLNDQTRFNNPW
jgi:hypothetical protein